MPKKPPPPEPCTLVAKIVSMQRDYYISENRSHEHPVGDEACIDIVGRIEQISPTLKQHLGREIDMSLMCARSFERDERTPPSDKPFLLMINLRKGGCSLMAYLPTDPFWALPAMVTSGAITHIEARFEPPSRGSGLLLSLHFGPIDKVTPVT